MDPHEVLELGHGLPVVGHDREAVAEVAGEEHRRLERPDDRHVRQLARDVDAGVVAAADHERVHAFAVRLDDLTEDLDLHQMLRHVVVDVARAAVEVRDLDLGARAHVRLEGLAHDRVVGGRPEGIQEPQAHRFDTISRP